MRRCTKCGEEKPLSDYYLNQGRPRAICKTCHTAQVLSKRDQPRNTSLKKDRRRGNKQWAIDYMGGKCRRCDGVFHPAAYDFHHIDPKGKDINPAHLMERTRKKIKEELDKCELLCSNCHRITHAEERDALAL